MVRKEDIEAAVQKIEAIKAELNCRADFGIYFKLRRAEMDLERLKALEIESSSRKID